MTPLIWGFALGQEASSLWGTRQEGCLRSRRRHSPPLPSAGEWDSLSWTHIHFSHGTQVPPYLPLTPAPHSHWAHERGESWERSWASCKKKLSAEFPLFLPWGAQASGTWGVLWGSWCSSPWPIAAWLLTKIPSPISGPRRPHACLRLSFYSLMEKPVLPSLVLILGLECWPHPGLSALHRVPLCPLASVPCFYPTWLWRPLIPSPPWNPLCAQNTLLMGPLLVSGVSIRQLSWVLHLTEAVEVEATLLCFSPTRSRVVAQQCVLKEHWWTQVSPPPHCPPNEKCLPVGTGWWVPRTRWTSGHI